MTKISGLGANLYIRGYDLSGDVGLINSIEDSGQLLDVTAIDKSARERIQGRADGGISFSAFFNDAALQEHVALKTMGSADKIIDVLVGTTIGNAAWGCLGKQVDYAPALGADGSIAFSVDVRTSDGQGLHSGEALTAGKRTDTGATNGATVDSGASAPIAYGGVFDLHVFAFTGTDVTVKVQDSTDGNTWADCAAFTQVTSGPTSERVTVAAAAGSVNRYLRAITETSGGFSSLQFAVIAMRRYA